MSDLDAAYSRAVYRVEADATVVFRFHSTAFDVPSDRRPVLPTGQWAIVTAYNPGRCTLSADDNAARNELLRRRLVARGLRSVRSEACDPGGQHREPGFLVLGLSRVDALAIARAFDQHAVVFGRGGRCGLLYTWTERWVVLPPIVVANHA